MLKVLMYSWRLSVCQSTDLSSSSVSESVILAILHHELLDSSVSAFRARQKGAALGFSALVETKNNFYLRAVRKIRAKSSYGTWRWYKIYFDGNWGKDGYVMSGIIVPPSRSYQIWTVCFDWFRVTTQCNAANPTKATNTLSRWLHWGLHEQSSRCSNTS